MTRFRTLTKVMCTSLCTVIGIFSGLPAHSQVTVEQLQTTVSELNDRLTAAESNISQTEVLSWLTLVTAIVAALAGAWLGGYLSKSAARHAENRALDLRKKEATISICAQWIELAETIASATLTLENADSQIEGEKLNEISAYGNWLEMVLLMKADGMLDESFLENFGFEGRVTYFRDRVQAAQKADGRLGDFLITWEQIAKI